MEYALESGIDSFNCESESELGLIDALASRRGVKAGFSIRVNPDVDAATHPYISTGLSRHKFGIDICEALAVYERARRQFPHLVAEGVSCHIGSQMLLDPSPILDPFDKLLALAAALRAQGHAIRHLDPRWRPRHRLPRGRSDARHPHSFPECARAFGRAASR